MKYLLTVDPGVSSGVALGTYSDTEAYQRTHAWQVPDGLEGFLEWLDFRRWEVTDGSRRWAMDDRLIADKDVTLISEKFTLLSHEYVANIEPVRIEGAMQALGMMPLDLSDKRWQEPAMMYWGPGEDKEEKKKYAQEWLKERDHWLTGTDVGQPDANDANSATLHAFAYMKAIQHLPTLRRWFR